VVGLLQQLGGQGIAFDQVSADFRIDPDKIVVGRSSAVGAGLGLDICYQIVVNHHHGDIILSSQPGDTRFQVRLPVEMAAPASRTTDSPQEAESMLAV
jgi:light-regulated signal transduction histidine kinase (bacteriophytochrome)